MRKLSDLRKHELIKLVNALKSQGEENASLIDAFLAGGKSEPVLKRYMKMIDKALDCDVLTNLDYDLEKMKRHVRSFLNASSDDLSKTKLLVYAVQKGNRLTLDLGDLDEEYYTDMLELFEEAVKSVSQLKKSGHEVFDLVEKLRNIVVSTKDVGWGYHDDLADTYYKSFGLFEKDKE